MQPQILILQATGTNRDPDTAHAVELAGGTPIIFHINQLRARPAQLHEFQMLVLPGGFSYGDALGAGRLFSIDLRWLFHDKLARFVEMGKPVIGICNGFQALVKSGWLPGAPDGAPSGLPLATLTRNTSNRFECRWVWLEPNEDSRCAFIRTLQERILCPVAHAEGRFVPRDDRALSDLQVNGQVTLNYVRADGRPAAYPDNPNGSTAGIAGICNMQGNVLGLMPHPENHIYPWQHPRWARGQSGNRGLALFEGAVRYAAEF